MTKSENRGREVFDESYQVGTSAARVLRKLEGDALGSGITTWTTNSPDIFTFFPNGQVAGRSNNLSGSGTGNISKFTLTWSNGVEVTAYCRAEGGGKFALAFSNSVEGAGLLTATQTSSRQASDEKSRVGPMDTISLYFQNTSGYAENFDVIDVNGTFRMTNWHFDVDQTQGPCQIAVSDSSGDATIQYRISGGRWIERAWVNNEQAFDLY